MIQRGNEMGHIKKDTMEFIRDDKATIELLKGKLERIANEANRKANPKKNWPDDADDRLRMISAICDNSVMVIDDEDTKPWLKCPKCGGSTSSVDGLYYECNTCLKGSLTYSRER